MWQGKVFLDYLLSNFYTTVMGFRNDDEPLISKSKKTVNEIYKRKLKVNYIDAFSRQVKELFFIENKKSVGKYKDSIYSSSEFRKFVKSKEKDSVYIYYPWNHTLIKTLKEKDFYILKTNRNQDLITADEQEKLYKLKIAVLGMSVGSNIAFVLTQSGVAKNIILADFDELETTNLNRIWAGVHQIGLNKAVIAARRIYEDNPFAKVTATKNTINKNRLERFLKDGKIECIVEEIDEMQMKITTRRLARKYKIPVLMITDNGDRAVLHVERYDLGYRKIFGKNDKYWDKRMASYQGKKDFADIVINDIVGGPDKIDPRMLLSANKVVKHQLISWPQLGVSALLGGIAVTIAIKKIVRGEDKRLFVREYIKIL